MALNQKSRSTKIQQVGKEFRLTSVTEYTTDEQGLRAHLAQLKGQVRGVEQQEQRLAQVKQTLLDDIAEVERLLGGDVGRG